MIQALLPLIGDAIQAQNNNRNVALGNESNMMLAQYQY